MLLTYKYRLKDKSGRKRLKAYAWGVNQVWNYCAAHHKDLLDRYRAGSKRRYWPTYGELQKLTAGASKDLGINAKSVQMTCQQFARSRDAHREALRFRSSGGPRRALGWIPFSEQGRQVSGNTITYCGAKFRWFGSRRRPLPPTAKGGAFVEDARGRWWVTFQVEVQEATPKHTGASVGIDLGLKTLGALSSGGKIENPRTFQRWVGKLSIAQRAGNRQRVRAISQKVRDVRRDHLHKVSVALVRDHQFISVGDVNPSSLGRTRMAKSVYDASWTSFRNMLRYKCQKAGAVFIEVSERWSSQTCSACGIIPASSPKGVGALGMRSWVCSDCGASHDRDVNAARNILRIGLSVQPHADESRLAA